MNSKEFTIFALGLVAGAAVTLVSSPGIRRQVRQNAEQLGSEAKRRVEAFGSEARQHADQLATEAMSKINQARDAVSTHKAAAANSFDAAKDAYKTSVAGGKLSLRTQYEIELRKTSTSSGRCGDVCSSPEPDANKQSRHRRQPLSCLPGHRC